MVVSRVTTVAEPPEGVNVSVWFAPVAALTVPPTPTVLAAVVDGVRVCYGSLNLGVSRQPWHQQPRHRSPNRKSGANRRKPT